MTTQNTYEKRAKTASRVFGFLSLVLIPIYTVRFATNESLIDSNMSLIGGAEKYKEFVIWGILCVVFFQTFLNYLFMLTRYDNRLTRGLLHTACSLLLLTVFTPFVPDALPVAAMFHNVFAMSAALLTMVVILRLVLHLAKCDLRIHRKALTFFVFSVGLSALLLLVTGISGLLEVVFIVLMCQLLFAIKVWLYRSDKVDVLDSLAEADRQRKGLPPPVSEEIKMLDAP